MDEGGEVINPVNTATENIPEVISPDYFTPLNDQTNFNPENVDEQIAQQIHTLQQEMQQQPIVENHPAKKEKAFKLTKMFGLGALVTILMSLWSSIKSMFGRGEAQYGH